MNQRKRVSIVCPVFNEEESVPLFYERLQKAIAPLQAEIDFELIFTNNRSTDKTFEVILALREQDPAIQVITLSRNFGYQSSVTSGLRYATGDAIVVIDVDCEDPPELIPQFIEEWRKGYDIVYGLRWKRSELHVVHLMRKAFYRINKAVADSDIILDMAEFALVGAHVRDQMLANNSTYPFLRAEAAFVGFQRKGIPYQRQPRLRGKTHYNFMGMARFAIAGILSSSTFPLRLVAYVCWPLLLWDLIVLIGIGVMASPTRLFLFSVMLNIAFLVLSITIVALYLARTYKNAVARPLYIVDWRYTTIPAPAFQSQETQQSVEVVRELTDRRGESERFK